MHVSASAMKGNRAVDGKDVTFEEHDGKTTLTTTSVFNTVEERDGVLVSGMVAGAAETYDRLDEYPRAAQRRGRLSPACHPESDDSYRSKSSTSARGAWPRHASVINSVSSSTSITGSRTKIAG
jgi:hypothetical protein